MKITMACLLLFLLSGLVKAESVRLLRADRDALQARVDIIQQAKKEIFVEYFSVWNDNQSIGGMALLIEAANRGLDVKILVDAMSHTIPDQTFSALLNLGNRGKGKLQIKVYNPLSINVLKATHRDHAKMLIADGKNLITGGRNVGDKYFGINKRRNFSDLDLIAQGDIAKVARVNFLETWNAPMVENAPLGNFSHRNLRIDKCRMFEPKNKINCKMKVRKAQKVLDNEIQRLLTIKEDVEANNEGDLFISHSGNNWFEESYEIKKIKLMSHGTAGLVTKETAYLNIDLIKTIANAKQQVNIISPYLIPTENLLAVFEGLIKKGVRIRIITNSINSTDNLFAQGGYRKMKGQLISMGLELYEYNGPDTIHAKTAVVDNRVVLIGTYNIDPRSAFINREIGVIADDMENIGLASELSDIIEDFRKNATLVGIDGLPLEADDLKNVSKTKKAMLKVISVIVPVIKNQL